MKFTPFDYSQLWKSVTESLKVKTLEEWNSEGWKTASQIQEESGIQGTLDAIRMRLKRMPSIESMTTTVFTESGNREISLYRPRNG